MAKSNATNLRSDKPLKGAKLTLNLIPSGRALSVALFFVFLFLTTAFTPAIAQDDPATEVMDSLAAVNDSLNAQFYPAPATNIRAMDTDNDPGGAVTVMWDRSVDDPGAGGKVKRYDVLRAAMDGDKVGEFTEVGDVPAGQSAFNDGSTTDGMMYVYKVVAVHTFYDEFAVLQQFPTESETSNPATSSGQWFSSQRINSLVGVIVLSFFILFYIYQARSGKKLFIRRIGGMDAVDEAVGRATEMGKKIYYISGLGDMDNMQTIASMTILGRVAQRAAEYETDLDVPVCRSMVMVTAREIVKESYSKAGRPDVYKDDQVHYLTDDQFGYAAAVDGMVVREKPATIFFMGQFFAESLILAETGNSIGAIQIAGTAMPSQLPFFVAACDYTLIGEELFAASAYLSKEPKLLGSLKGQDVGKAIILVAIIVGLLLETFGVWQFSNLFSVV